MDRERRLSEVIEALTGWTVAVVQFNGMVADGLGVTATDLQCLYVLSRHGPATPGELGRQVNLTSGAASRMVDRLESAGRVVRKPHPHDRRRVVVEATHESLEQIARYYIPLTERLRGHLTGFDDDQLTRLLRFARDAQDATDDEIQRLDAQRPS
jgi:DNA-binding MarR family transcriptional regulator